MVEFSVNPQRFDPYKNFKFRVRWDNRYVAGVSKVGALKLSTEVVEHRVGGDSSTSRKSRVEPLAPRLRLVVSTTRVSPSQRPREVPRSLRGADGWDTRPSIGMSRVSCITSIWMARWSAVCWPPCRICRV